MSSLRDMEELISDIVDVELKEYMREALTCYMTGAHRACVVLSFIAIFEDLFKKLDGMATTNKAAKAIYTEISKKRDEQKVYESDLLNKLKSEKIITDIDADFLTVLRTLRNKAAHPSGHKPTAEEARYVYSETINRFLSKPVLSTTQVADQILSKLTNSYLFPTYNIQDHAVVVTEGVKNLHHDGYSYLLKKLMESLDNTNEQIKNNAKRYLLGLSFKPLNKDVIEQIKKQIIVECSSDESKRQCLMECISTNPNLLNGMEDIVYLRLNKMFEDTISATVASDQHIYLRHPVQIANSVFGLEKEIIDRCFSSSIEAVLDKYKLSPVLMNHVKGHEWARQKVIQLIFGQAGSSTFSEANSFAQSVNSYDGDISSLMEDIDCFELIVHICTAGEWGAFGAEGMVKGKFNNIPKIKVKAGKALQDNIVTCQKVIERIRPTLCDADGFEEKYF
ncbi:DUF4145 domain-containing protein [Pectobacterium carotovorum]|uniref:DUF4145 domain-containing protein n=1 Tax=Pectobacterium carotovorum TaxID=554 RepID=UPI00057DAA41|nr:hypothetical protein [Pectobacterium carotovorum]KHT13362.1 hypothetical protein RC96_19345 [Pectobacterium carotovorum subsp. carotovorum]